MSEIKKRLVGSAFTLASIGLGCGALESVNLAVQQHAKESSYEIAGNGSAADTAEKAKNFDIAAAATLSVAALASVALANSVGRTREPRIEVPLRNGYDW